MNKEKLRKQYILMFSLQTICLCIFWFLFLVRDIVNLHIIYLSLIVVIAAFIGRWVDNNSLAVMPQIISIYDTVEKFEKQIVMLAAIIVVLLIISGVIMLKFNSILGRFLASFIWMFISFIRLTQRKIEYIKNKPEGLNF